MTEARHRKKAEKQFYQLIADKLKAKVQQWLNELKFATKQAKHRKKIDKEKVESITEKVIIKTAILFAKIFIPLGLLLFCVFEFGGYVKDAIVFIWGIFHSILNVFRFIGTVIELIIKAINQVILLINQLLNS
ncbi:hypothetical protein PU629_17400 [Pullulanibacillus sp. KACC 23026]|uniref:hypothetical protein n=1 Tax=Pullulanibacillus sp. KACC 23026 TaxID=3028315 RepID=UPI0023AEB6C7|nr:hypothetical protein [Pullulanibacillus sp. KACC 23026]WEG11886.1 hypothetical protein PU629_17400 [Pullulanibacillus sp. KACC 23026]